MAPPPVRKTAAQWIEGFKKDFHDHPDRVRNQPDYPASFIARIMAARELSNSVRGKASTLNAEMSKHRINERAEAIMASESFKAFADTLKKPGYIEKAEAIFAKKHSHGGELDDLFRDYLAMRPAGKMPNDPELKRWMPTVGQRVEQLQKQASKALKSGKEVYKEAAEIMLLRDAAHVQRGGAGLKNRVPLWGENCLFNLGPAVEKYAKKQPLRDAFEHSNGKKYILSGHGGEMMLRVANQLGGIDLDQDEPVRAAQAGEKPKEQAHTNSGPEVKL